MDKIKELEKKVHESSGEEKVERLNDLAYAIYNSDPEKTEQYAKDALELAKKINSNYGIARSYNIIGISFHRRGNYDQAMRFYNQARTVFEKIDDKHKIASLNNNTGAIFEKLGNYDNALESHFQALKIWEEMDDLQHTSASLNNIGIIYEKQGSYDHALEYHFKSLKIKEELGDTRNAAFSYNNIGIIYEKLNKLDLALEYHLKALKIKEEFGEKQTIAVSYINIGNIYTGQLQNDKAMEYCIKAQNLFEETSDKYGLVTTYISIGIINIRFQNYKLAQEYLVRSLELAQKIKAKGLELKTIDALAELYETQEDFGQALQYYKKYTDLEKEIFNEQKSKQMAEMQTKYETYKKEKEAEIYRLKNVELVKANEVIHIKNKKLEIHEEQLKLINKIIRHDIINNLAVIESAINLYKGSKDKSMLDEVLLKVDKSIKLIRKMREHESLIASENLKFIEISDVVKKVIKNYPDIDFTVTGKEQILADDAIDSVIDNIISNAVTHGETQKIDIQISTSGDMCSLRIADYGIGIPDKIKKKIFDEGFIYGKKGHTGIGLYIVNESVKRWGGEISVEDNKPKGTVFILHLQSVR